MISANFLVRFQNMIRRLRLLLLDCKDTDTKDGRTHLELLIVFPAGTARDAPLYGFASRDKPWTGCDLSRMQS